MCLAVPVKITELNIDGATGEVGGVKKKINTDFLKELKPGDYVLLHAGFAIEKIDPEEARKTLALWRELEEQ